MEPRGGFLFHSSCHFWTSVLAIIVPMLPESNTLSAPSSLRGSLAAMPVQTITGFFNCRVVFYVHTVIDSAGMTHFLP